MRLSAELHREAEVLVGRRLGLRLPPERLADLERVLADGLRASRLPSADAYLGWLEGLSIGSPEWSRIAARLTVGETYFFRDRASFEGLAQHVLPALIAARRSEGALRLRLWSAACATGEEAYSLAILLDGLIPDYSAWSITLLATDINQEALAAARRGLYREWSLRETSTEVRDRYFRTRRGSALELTPRIRERVTFGPLNLAEDGYPSLATNTCAMDVILCRNVLMYFDPAVQRKSVVRLQSALVQGGWLLLSPVEASPELLRPLKPVDLPGAVFHRKEEEIEPPPPTAVFPPHTSLGSVLKPTIGRLSPSEAAREEGVPADGMDELLSKGRALADQGQLETARRVAEAAVDRARLDPEGHLLLAAICQELGDTAAARQGLRRAIYLAPDCAPAHLLLGTLLLRSGEPRRGRRCLENAIRLLESLPNEQAVEGAGGLTAGRLKETARAYLAER